MVAVVKIDHALCMLEGVFLEIPHLELGVDQACELTGLDEVTCSVLLQALEQARFLWQRESGLSVLRSDWVTKQGGSPKES
jgi:hypothetical protein